MSKKLLFTRPSAPKIAAIAVGIATIVSVPGVLSSLHRFGVDLGHHPLPTALGALAVVLAVVGFWDSILRVLGIRTPASVERSIRRWLKEQGYTVEPCQGETDGFCMNIRGSHDPHSYNVELRRDTPWGVIVTTALNNSPAVAASIAKMPLNEYGSLRTALVRQLASMDNRLNFKVTLAHDKPNLVDIFVPLVADEISYSTFMNAVHALRRALLVTNVLIADATMPLGSPPGS